MGGESEGAAITCDGGLTMNRGEEDKEKEEKEEGRGGERER